MTKARFYEEMKARSFKKLPDFTDASSGFYELCKCFSDIAYFSEIDHIKPVFGQVERSYDESGVNRAKLWLQEFIDDQIEAIDRKALLEAICEMHRYVREEYWISDEMFLYMFGEE